MSKKEKGQEKGKKAKNQREEKEEILAIKMLFLAPT
jgi:hypothetical protein